MKKLSAAVMSLMVLASATAAVAQGAPTTSPQGQTQEDQRGTAPSTGR